MGALPKRRISTARRGKRRSQKNLDTKQVAHHGVPKNKKKLVTTLKSILKTQ